ncbi:unnamed protein product, partial [marine sediment metagenome]
MASIKEELIDTGWTMERIWNELVSALQHQKATEAKPEQKATGEKKEPAPAPAEKPAEKVYPKTTILPDGKAAFPTSHKDGDVVIIKPTGETYMWSDATSGWKQGKTMLPPYKADPVVGTKTADAETEEHFTPPDDDSDVALEEGIFRE